MAPIAREAVGNLLKVTAPAREIAAWYTANPGKLFFHKGARHLRGVEVLSVAQLSQLLWGDEGGTKAARYWATKTAKLEALPLEDGTSGYRFADVERAVIEMLPDTFPHVPGDSQLLCKDAMALFRVNENHSSKATYLCMFSCVDYSTISNALGTIKDGRDTLFSRYGYTVVKSKDGSYYFQDQFGRRPQSKEEYEREVRRAKEMEAHFRRVLTKHRAERGEPPPVFDED